MNQKNCRIFLLQKSVVKKILHTFRVQLEIGTKKKKGINSVEMSSKFVPNKFFFF